MYMYCINYYMCFQDGQTLDSVSGILLSKYPTTLIDLTTGEVRHSSLHKHHARRHEALKQHLDTLWKGRKESQVYTSRNLFHAFEDAESLVNNFLEEVSLGLLESFVTSCIGVIEFVPCFCLSVCRPVSSSAL